MLHGWFIISHVIVKHTNETNSKLPINKNELSYYLK